ncbi:hypothetical protein FACS18942_01870 [Planctomycetales bacterium]|nr:hypothetical protein FACS18942_01870 [Planctomycetales bacterium]
MNLGFDLSRYTYALVTSTTYGQWLPGNERGYVERGKQNIYGTQFAENQPALKRFAEEQLKSEPIVLHREQAEIILKQWQKESSIRLWTLYVVAIMPNHFHLAVAADEGTKKDSLLRTFKSRAGFVLNKQYGKRTWWTTSGSVRFCFDEQALKTRIEYVRNQRNPLLVWENELLMK